MGAEEASPHQGFLMQVRSSSEMQWRPSRFLAVAMTPDEACSAVAAYAEKQVELDVVEQGLEVLAHAKELGVGDGQVMALI